MIYLDNAATTPLRPEVLEVMMPYLTEHYGNPSSIYKLGRDSRIAIDNAREKVANILGTDSQRIYFTSGGTESDNWAVKGVAHSNSKKGKHIITSEIEHHAILHACDTLEREGYEITRIPPDGFGIISPEKLKKAIRDDTILVTIMQANNEIGTIQPIAELAKIAHEKNAYFHTDAVQSLGHIPVNVDDLGVDLLSLSGHKFGGPKGVGVLYVRKGVRLAGYMDGGGQERNMRAGTENTAGIVGLAHALELATSEIESESARQITLRDKLINNILSTIPYSRLNGSADKRVPNNVNISFEFIEGESLLLLLDMQGIAASSGSACTSGSLDPSHVLLSIGLPHEKAHGSLRLTLGRDTTEQDVDFVVEKLDPIVARLREMSPLKAHA
ncbi:cysteine desulfurase NifS [Clostridia bacterium]|nr:cysteine desulfurase NifS [Clostridia bacterium]